MQMHAYPDSGTGIFTFSHNIADLVFNPNYGLHKNFQILVRNTVIDSFKKIWLFSVHITKVKFLTVGIQHRRPSWKTPLHWSMLPRFPASGSQVVAFPVFLCYCKSQVF